MWIEVFHGAVDDYLALCVAQGKETENYKELSLAYTFLEQTSWSNFNEGNDLEAAVEDYKRKFGFYPSAVLADRIYQTRSNKLFCSQRGIRLAGLPLGRRNASDTDTKIKRQIYKDSCDRNAIEGRNGNSKRHSGLDRIFSKLDETAKTEAAFILLAMNASLRLARFLLFPSAAFSFHALFSRP